MLQKWIHNPDAAPIRACANWHQKKIAAKESRLRREKNGHHRTNLKRDIVRHERAYNELSNKAHRMCHKPYEA